MNLLVRRVIGDRVGCGHRNLVVATGAPEPETILPEWSAAFRTVVANEIDLVGRVQVVRGLARNGGRGLQAVRRVHVPAGPADFVRAALGDHVQLHARRFDTRVGTAGGGLHLFERVEIEVQRRRAGGAHVGDVHTIDVPGVVASERAFGVVVRLLTAQASADVDAVDLHAGNGLHDRPQVTRLRDFVHLHTRDVR